MLSSRSYHVRHCVYTPRTCTFIRLVSRSIEIKCFVGPRTMAASRIEPWILHKAAVTGGVAESEL